MKVAIFHNNERGFAFSRWVPEAPLTLAFTGELNEVEVTGRTEESILELIYAGTNRGSGQEWPRYMAQGLRSLSVGDVVCLYSPKKFTSYAVASMGFDAIDVHDDPWFKPWTFGW